MDKPTLIMVPGFMCDERLFAPQIEALSRGFDVRVFIPSCRAISITDMADNLLGSAPASFALLGLSMGAIVAMQTIRHAPDRVTRLALFDANPHPNTPESTAERRRQIALVQAGDLKDVMKSHHIARYFKAGEYDGAIADLCQDMAQDIGADAFINHQNALIQRSNQCEALQNVKVPALIACGANDQLCPPENHELMHKIMPGSLLKIIANAGHLPTLEQPDITSRILTDWLRGARQTNTNASQF